LPGLAFAALALHSPAQQERGVRLWSVWVGAALVVVLLLRLPGAWPFFTVDKTSYLAWIPLALTGGGALAAFLAARRPVTRVLVAALLLVPATVLSLVSIALDPRFASRQPFDLPVFARLKESLPADAVLVTPPGDVDPGVFLARDLWTVDRWDGVVRGYDTATLALRAAAIDSLFRTGHVSAAAGQAFEVFPRPLFAVWPDQAGRSWPGRTPGEPRRRFVTAGTRPAWAGERPVATFGGVVTVTPLNATARAAWPGVVRRADAAGP
jgi:hypothetical protein